MSQTINLVERWTDARPHSFLLSRLHTSRGLNLSIHEEQQEEVVAGIYRLSTTDLN